MFGSNEEEDDDGVKETFICGSENNKRFPRLTETVFVVALNSPKFSSVCSRGAMRDFNFWILSSLVDVVVGEEEEREKISAAKSYKKAIDDEDELLRSLLMVIGAKIHCS